MDFWATSPPEPTTLAGRFGSIIAGIGVKIGAHLSANRHLEPILALVYHYLRRAVPRLERLIARWRAGKLTPRPRTASPAAIAAEAIPSPRKPRLPTRRGWLVRLVQPTAQHIGHLQALVATPEMAELLAAAPQAGRILRPLFRMFATELPDILRLPPRPPRPRPPRPAKAPPAVPPVTASERRAWRNYSPGPLRPPWPIDPTQPNRKFSPA